MNEFGTHNRHNRRPNIYVLYAVVFFGIREASSHRLVASHVRNPAGKLRCIKNTHTNAAVDSTISLWATGS